MAICAISSAPWNGGRAHAWRSVTAGTSMAIARAVRPSHSHPQPAKRSVSATSPVICSTRLCARKKKNRASVSAAGTGSEIRKR